MDLDLWNLRYLVNSQVEVSSVSMNLGDRGPGWKVKLWVRLREDALCVKSRELKAGPGKSRWS